MDDPLDVQRIIQQETRSGGSAAVEMAVWKDPVDRFVEFLRFRTVSAEGPSGSYQEVSYCTLARFPK